MIAAYPGFGMMPPIGGSPFMGPMGGLMIGMQMMQLMQMMSMLIGQQQQMMMGGFGGGPMGPGMGDMFGMPPMGFDPSFGGMPQMPWGYPGGGCQPFSGSPPCCCGRGGGYPDFSCGPANPGAQVPNCGPSPSKQQIGGMLDAAAAKYGIPPEILKAVAYKESGWNPNARGDGGASFGMMQIYTRAHPDYNVAAGQANPGYNIEYAARMLSNLYKKYGNWAMAVKRYNGAGPMAERYSASVMQLAQQRPWQRFGVA